MLQIILTYPQTRAPCKEQTPHIYSPPLNNQMQIKHLFLNLYKYTKQFKDTYSLKLTLNL